MDKQTTIFTVMSKLANDYNAINLAQGFPGFSCDEELIKQAHFFMQQGMNQYSPMMGALPLRQVIQERVQKDYDYTLDISEEVCVTVGATEAVYVAIQSIVEEGDEVIVLEPAFDVYVAGIEKAGGIPVFVSLQYPDFSIDWNQVEAVVSDKTKLLILNSPHNPTGAIVSKQDIDILSELAEKHNFYVLSDEVYEYIVFDGQKHHSVLANESLRQRSYVTFSLGKTFHVTGWRVGYCIAPPFLMEKFKNIHQYVTFCPATPFQLACAEFYKNEEYLKNLSPFFQEKRDYFLEVMKETAFEPIHSSGTYFQLMSYKNIESSYDIEYAKQLVKEYQVAAIPISFFYHDNTDHKVLRFCFAKEKEELLQAAKKLTLIQ